MHSLYFRLFLSLSLNVIIGSCHLHHHHRSNHQLPKRWHHPRDHPSNELFRRAASTDGATYADVGSPQWSTGYPDMSNLDTIARVPQAWQDALNKAVAAGKIPDIPQSKADPNAGMPTYPDGHDPNSADVCSATYKCRMPGDIWDAPDNIFASSFDDGPQDSTSKLIQFLQQNNVTTTHFMIGSNILTNPNQFKEAFDAGHAIAVHTWSHRQMTTLNNTELLGEFGWTMQLIHNSTGGRVPRFWRPPTGDTDRRVSAIAKEVFGLETIIWNKDPSDWSVTLGKTTQDKIQSDVSGFLDSPKSPGLIVLEHEIVDQTVNAFMNIFPEIASKGWTFKSLADVVDQKGAYQNVNGNTVSTSGVLLQAQSNDPTNNGSSSSASGSTVGATAAPSPSTSNVSNTKNLPSAATRASTSWTFLLFIFGLVMFGGR